MPDTPMSIDERVARLLVDEDYRQAKLMAENYSPPPNARPVSESRELELWEQTDPTFDEQRAWAEHLAAGTDPWVARTDIALRKYPNRKPLMEQGRPRVSEQIAYANAMAQRAQRAAVKRQEDAERVRSYALPPFEATPGPVPMPLPRAQPMPAEPAVQMPSPTTPRESMTGPGLPPAGPETGV